MQASTILYREFNNFRDSIDAIIKSYNIKDDCDIEIKAAIDNIYNHIDDYKLEIEEQLEAEKKINRDLVADADALEMAIIITPQSLKQYNEIVDYLTTQQFPYINSVGVQIPLF